jgi:alpha-beta hydrolase superfamily lysophospholipase
MNEERFEGAGGLHIFVRSTQPEGTLRGQVVIIHGFKSHSGLYDWPMEQLTMRGFAVHALDMRGHGNSEGERLYVERFADYVEDVDRVVGIARSRAPGAPIFMLGHSAGGVVAATYALDHPESIDGLVTESFAFEVSAPEFALSVLKGIGRLAPHAHVLPLKDEQFSRDTQFVQRMKSDPHIPRYAYPAQTVAELLRADERLRREAKDITMPVLILHGTGDKAANPNGSRHFYDLVGSKDKTLKIYDGFFHDLLHDVGCERVMADVTEWITTHVPPR